MSADQSKLSRMGLVMMLIVTMSACEATAQEEEAQLDAKTAQREAMKWLGSQFGDGHESEITELDLLNAMTHIAPRVADEELIGFYSDFAKGMSEKYSWVAPGCKLYSKGFGMAPECNATCPSNDQIAKGLFDGMNRVENVEQMQRLLGACDNVKPDPVFEGDSSALRVDMAVGDYVENRFFIELIYGRLDSAGSRGAEYKARLQSTIPRLAASLVKKRTSDLIQGTTVAFKGVPQRGVTNLTFYSHVLQRYGAGQGDCVAFYQWASLRQPEHSAVELPPDVIWRGWDDCKASWAPSSSVLRKQISSLSLSQRTGAVVELCDQISKDDVFVGDLVQQRNNLHWSVYLMIRHAVTDARGRVPNFPEPQRSLMPSIIDEAVVSLAKQPFVR